MHQVEQACTQVVITHGGQHGWSWLAVMATDSAGALPHVYRDVTGWHATDTGVRAATVAAVEMGGNRPYPQPRPTSSLWTRGRRRVGFSAARGSTGSRIGAVTLPDP
jgi:hypothetical protein